MAIRCLISILVLACASVSAAATEVFVSPRGGPDSYQGRTVQTVKLEEALAKAAPGARIQLLPGSYIGEFSLNRSGEPGKPIVILGARDASTGKLLTTFDGKRAPAYEGAPCLLLKAVEWVSIEALSVKGCWPFFIRANDSRYVAFRDSEIVDSRIVFLARGGRSQHFLIERNRWTQDPSQRMWQELSWEEIHHGTLMHFNGALFGSRDIAGDVIFRDNEIAYAYNGIRMVASADEVGKHNVNVQVYGNLFRNIRDNPIEPEGTASHWWIHHNRIRNGYAWFSFTTLDAREIYVFGNTGWFDSRPCDGGRREGHCRGKVFKFEEAEPYPSGTIYVFHNSWYTPSPLVADGWSRNFRHWNNAIQFSKPELTLFSEAKWHPSYRFDHDLSNVKFDGLLSKNGQEKNGVVGDPKFKDPGSGNFELQKDSPAIDRGKVLRLGGWKSEFAGKAPDIGAFEGDRPFQGPPFRRLEAGSAPDPRWDK